MVKAICINKNRDLKGRIVSYTLRDKEGQTTEMTGQQIKQAISNKQLDIINLQIDKAGRLVDRATEKSNKHEENLFTVEDLIYMRKNKNCKIKVYNRKDGKEYIGEVTGYWTSSDNEYLHNELYVYVPQLGTKCVVGIGTKDPNAISMFWKALGKEDKFYGEWKENDYINFYKRNKDKYKIIFVIGNQYKVDAKPNKNGLYTITTIGKFTDEDANQCRVYKIKNNQTGKESWGGISASVANNEFTNVGFKKDRMILDRNIPVVDVSDQYKKFSLLKKKVAKEVITYLKTGGITYCDGKIEYFDEDKKLQGEYIKTIFSEVQDWDSFVVDTLDEILNHDKKVYYACFGFDREDLGAYYSYNKKDIETYISEIKKELEFSGTEAELNTNI